VSLIVADGNGDSDAQGISIFDVGKEASRFRRMKITPKLILKKAKEVDAKVYHFHDPELIPIGLKLLKLGKKVIYDAHEDLPRQIMGKPYLNKLLKPIVARVFEIYEDRAAKKFSYICTATPFIEQRFNRLNRNTEAINNFPILNELFSGGEWEDKKEQICYIGGITEIRGIEKLMDSISIVNKKLLLAGSFENETLRTKITNKKGWEHTHELGFISREEAKEVLRLSKLGVVTFLPLPNHIDAQPNKMFEYMGAGVPVLASNFPLWREIIEKNNCGICVDPNNEKEIAEAILKILNNDEFAKKLGNNGRKAVKEKYNWEKQSIKLIRIYENLVN